MRLIDVDSFRHQMYHEVFEKDSEDQRWDSGCWMRYRLFEKVLEEQPELEIIRCKDCKHRILNEQYENRKGEWGYKYYCDLDTGDPYELGRIAENDDWFCADAERK